MKEFISQKDILTTLEQCILKIFPGEKVRYISPLCVSIGRPLSNDPEAFGLVVSFDSAAKELIVQSIKIPVSKRNTAPGGGFGRRVVSEIMRLSQQSDINSVRARLVVTPSAESFWSNLDFERRPPIGMNPDFIKIVRKHEPQ